MDGRINGRITHMLLKRTAALRFIPMSASFYHYYVHYAVMVLRNLDPPPKKKLQWNLVVQT